MQRLSIEEIDVLESAVDSTFISGLNLREMSRNQGLWQIMTVLEDAVRLNLYSSFYSSVSGDVRAIMGDLILFLDKYKYTARFALSAIVGRTVDDGRPGFHDVPGADYTSMAEFAFKHASGYADAIRIFSSVRSGKEYLYRMPDSDNLHILKNNQFGGYNALELLPDNQSEDQDEGNVNGLSLLLGTFYRAALIEKHYGPAGAYESEVYELVQRVRLEQGKLRFKILAESGRAIKKNFIRQKVIFSKDWKFAWGVGGDVVEYFKALNALCFYHLVSVHFGALRFNLEGLGVDQICLCIKKNDLNTFISKIGGIGLDVTDRITQAFTYGVYMDFPDPALQPLISIGEDYLCVPCIMVLSSNWPRNVLALQARIDESRFSSQSKFFESTMIEQFSKVKRRDLILKFNRRVCGEEVDVIIIDVKAKAVLICEMKWMLAPGDVREVLNRKKEIQKKVFQVIRKFEAVKVDSRRFGVETGIEDKIDSKWSILPLLIIDGYAGCVSPKPNLAPVVPLKVFLKCLDQVECLDKLHAVLCSNLWLPRRGVDYLVEDEVVDLCGVGIHMRLMRNGTRSYMGESLNLYLEEAVQLDNSVLTGTDWEEAMKEDAAPLAGR